jgi:hypothetical protein
MAQLAPPPPPQPVTTAEDDGMARLQFRLWQLWITTLTLLITVWFITFGAIAAIIALVVAKHVLVAIYLMGNYLYPAYRDEPDLRESGF